MIVRFTNPFVSSLRRTVATTRIRTFVAPTAALSQSDLPYHLVVGLPALSPTMSSGALAEWYVAEGDKFGAGDAVAKIETDKATIDFEAQDDGYVAKLLKEAGTGADISVGTPIMITVEEEADVAAFKNFVLSEESKTSAVEADVSSMNPTPIADTPASPSPVSPLKPAEQVAAPSVPAPPSSSPSPSAVAAPAGIAEAAAPASMAPPGQATVAWGFSASVSSPLAKTLALQQKTYIDAYGTTGQKPL